MTDMLKLPDGATPGEIFRLLADWYDKHGDLLRAPTINLNDHTRGCMSGDEATRYVAAIAARMPTETIRARENDSIWTYVHFGPATRLCVFTGGHRDCAPACPHPVHEAKQ